jgi:hypothetical protein
MSRSDFDRRFPDEEACARYLAAKRWPDGFVCPACGHDKGWELATKPFTRECAGCHRQTSVTAGTVMHRSKLPLRTWFEAIRLLTSHANGISVEQAQVQFGIGSSKTAWLLLHKLRRAMVSPDRGLLRSLVEEDETEIPDHLEARPDQGARHPECGQAADHRRRRVVRGRPPAPGTSRTSVRGFVERVVERGATVVSDGLAGYRKLKEHRHVGRTVGAMAAHVLLPWVHRTFANLKRWLTGTFHGARKPHLARYLDEFVFRWNRRRHTRTAFETLLGLVIRLPHASLRDFVDQRV